MKMLRFVVTLNTLPGENPCMKRLTEQRRVFGIKVTGFAWMTRQGNLWLSPTRLYHSGHWVGFCREILQGFVDGWNLYDAFSGNPSLSIDPVGLEGLTEREAEIKAFLREAESYKTIGKGKINYKEFTKE